MAQAAAAVKMAISAMVQEAEALLLVVSALRRSSGEDGGAAWIIGPTDVPEIRRGEKKKLHRLRLAPLSLKSLCGGGVPSSHPWGLRFLSFFGSNTKKEIRGAEIRIFTAKLIVARTSGFTICCAMAVTRV